MDYKSYLFWLLPAVLSSFTFAQPEVNIDRNIEPVEVLRPDSNNTESAPRCCYGSDWYGSGEMVDSFPQKCLSLYCKWNKIVPIYHHGAGECNCCEYNGKMYKSGEKIPNVCIDMTCKNGQWEVQYYYNPECRKCSVRDDPHFNPFDGIAFDYHGVCNYSITQQGFGYTSPWGIYGDFKPCNTIASCLDTTTFVDNPNTIIVINHSQINEISVNVNSYVVPSTVQPVMAGTNPTPVLGWSLGGCTYLLGSQGFYIEYCAHSYTIWRTLSIWAYPSLANDLYGLCGQFDDSTSNGLLWRDSVTASIPPHPYSPLNGFGNSWQTNEQSDNECLPQKGKRAVEGDDILPVDCEEDVLMDKIEYCLALIGDELSGVDAETQAAFCAVDLCALKQSGATEEQFEEYKLFFRGVIDNERFIKDRTRSPPNDDNGEDDGNGGNDNGVNTIQGKDGKIKIKSKHESLLEVELNL